MSALAVTERCAVCDGELGVGCNLGGPRWDCPRTQLLVALGATPTYYIVLVSRRHRLMLAAVDDRWYAPWRRAARLRTIARTEAELNATGIPW